MFKVHEIAQPRAFYFDGYDFVDVRDVADGIYRWQHGEKGQVYAGRRALHDREVIETLGRSAGALGACRSFVHAAAAVVPALYAYRRGADTHAGHGGH